MQDKAIVHIMSKKRMKSDAFTAEIDAMERISEKHKINNIIYYKGEVIEYRDLINKLEKFGIYLCNYSNKEDLKNQIQELSEQKDIIFISTPMELLVGVVNELKENFGHVLSENMDIFRDKYLQREMIQEHNPDLGIRYMTGAPEDLHIDDIEKNVGYPFIVKPVDGVQSSGVAKIGSRNQYEEYMSNYNDFHDRLKARGVDNKDLIIEEFITGKLYSVDYFVTPEGEVRMSKAVKVKLGIDVGVEDYCNIARIATEKTEDDFKGKRLKTFVNSTVKATGIKNTFIHHEFKINKEGDFKTIELNGRVGGGRLDLMQRAYGLNLYELVFSEDTKPGKLKQNNMVINIYATKRGILKDFNRNFLEKIKGRESYVRMELEESQIGKDVGLTKDGFIKVGGITIAHKDYKILRKDYLYIKNRYEDLLEIEELQISGKIERKSVFSKVKSLVWK